MYVRINSSGPGLNCWLVREHRFPDVEAGVSPDVVHLQPIVSIYPLPFAWKR